MQLIASITYILLLLSIANVELLLTKYQFRIFVKNVASAFHESWRRHLLNDNPLLKNRFRLTRNGSHYNSSDFIYPMYLTAGLCLVHRNLKVARDLYNSSLTYVDIINMNYDELPYDKSYDNQATARIACIGVLRNVRQKRRIFNRSIIDKISNKVHIAWSERNPQKTAAELHIPYVDLPEVEKDKDRRAVFIACRLFNELHLYRYFQTTPVYVTEPSIE